MQDTFNNLMKVDSYETFWLQTYCFKLKIQPTDFNVDLFVLVVLSRTWSGQTDVLPVFITVDWCNF